MGSYTYAVASDTWQWSDGVYAIHGLRQGDVVPTMALLLSHAHAADRRHAGQLLRACLRDGRLFSLLYRIIDAAGQLRLALIAGEGTFDGAGLVTGLRGYLIDVTVPQSRARSQEVASGLRKAMASRATIEQAKGALMLVYGLDADEAFSLLSWQSQHSNVKLRDLAERLVAVVGGDAHASAAVRQRLDEIVYSLPVGHAAASPAAGQPEDGLLTVVREAVDGAVVLHLHGEVDMATGPLLEEHLARAITLVTPPAPLVADLSQVRHLGSVGVALLTACHQRCQAAGIPLRIVAGDGPIASILAGLEVHDQMAGALSPAPHGSAGRPWPGSPDERG
jgi:anti-anti-sigma factor